MMSIAEFELLLERDMVADHMAKKPIALVLHYGPGNCINEAVTWLYDNIGEPGKIWNIHSESRLKHFYVFFDGASVNAAIEFKLRFGAENAKRQKKNA